MWQHSLEKRLVIQEEEEEESVLYVGRWEKGKYHCVAEGAEEVRYVNPSHVTYWRAGTAQSV
jgi:hypothetical protein